MRLKGGHETQDPRLDRVPQWDEANRQYPLRAVVPSTQLPARGRGWSVKHWLDQGQEGACVSFAWHHEALALPKRAVFGDDAEATTRARERYRVMQTVDEWPGEDYEGTSVLAGAKVMQQLGYFDEYRWAFSVEDIILALVHEGPVVLGVDWYEGMYDPDDRGFLNITGSKVGGHAILCSSVSMSARRFTLWNSWGQGWGMNGRAYVRFEDMQALLNMGGEACVPVGRRVV